MKIKKISAVMLLFSMLMSSFGVSAKLVTTTIEAPQGWEFVYSGNASTSNSTAKISTEQANTGSNSLNLGTTLATTGEGNVEVKYLLPPDAPKGDYELTFYLKGTYTKSSVFAGVGENKGIADSLIKFTETTGDWNMYKKTITYNGEEALKIKIVKGTSSVYIDDVSMKSDGTELIENGGFEIMTVTTTSSIETEPAAENPSLSGITAKDMSDVPRNFITYNGDNLTLSWINPQKAIKSVKLYETMGGGDTLLKDTLSTTSGGPVSCSLPSEDNDRTFRLVYTYSDDTAAQYVFGGDITSKTENSDWNIAYNVGEDDNGNEILPMCAEIDRTQKHGAEAALKVRSNATKAKEGSIVISQDVNLESDKTYMLYVWEMSSGESNYTIKCGGAELTGLTVKEDNGYKLNSYRITGGGDDISITFVKQNESVWIDDVELYTFENGNPVGENLLKNGDFESDIVTTLPQAVSNISAVGLENSIKLSWTKPEGEYQNIAVYRKQDENYVKCATLGKGEESVTIGSLAQDTEYEFAVTAVCKELNDSPAVTVKAVAKGPSAEIGDVTVAKQTDNIYKISRNIKNNYAGADYKAELIVALVQDGVIRKIASSGSEAIEEENSKLLTVNLDVTGVNLQKSHIEVYTWDALFGKSILTPCEKYEF